MKSLFRLWKRIINLHTSKLPHTCIVLAKSMNQIRRGKVWMENYLQFVPPLRDLIVTMTRHHASQSNRNQEVSRFVALRWSHNSYVIATCAKYERAVFKGWVYYLKLTFYLKIGLKFIKKFDLWLKFLACLVLEIKHPGLFCDVTG